MIVACHWEGQGQGDNNLKSKFWGCSIQVDLVGTLKLQFDDGEVFQWTKVFFYHNVIQYHNSKIEDNHVITKYLWNCNNIIQLVCSSPTIFKLWHYVWQVTTSIYNLILSKLYVNHYGTMHIQGNQELSCRLKMVNMNMNMRMHVHACMIIVVVATTSLVSLMCTYRSTLETKEQRRTNGQMLLFLCDSSFHDNLLHCQQSSHVYVDPLLCLFLSLCVCVSLSMFVFLYHKRP